jgi:hypothetical protein
MVRRDKLLYLDQNYVSGIAKGKLRNTSDCVDRSR